MINKTISQIGQFMEQEIVGNYDKHTMVQGVEIDSRKIRKGNLYIPLIGQRVDGHSFVEQAAKDGAVLSFWQKDHTPYPTCLPIILVDDTQKALARLAHAYLMSLDVKVIAITGSNGKTSCKDMMYSIFSQEKKTQKTIGNRNNEIGMPLTILDLDEDVEYAILEMGMENKGEIAELCAIASPDIAVITTIGSAHMENLGSKKQIADAKCEIYDGLKPNGLFIYNKDCPEIDEVLSERKLDPHKKIESFGKEGQARILSDIAYESDSIRFMTSIMKDEIVLHALGDHQAMNALPCIMAAKSEGLSDQAVLKGLSCLQMTKMRTQLLNVKKARILDDSYKSNPESAKAAIDTLMELPGEKHIAVLADMLDLGEQEQQLHAEIGKYAKEKGVDLLFAYGPLSKHTADAFGGNWFATKEEIEDRLQPLLDEDVVICIKGSRAMGMDTIVAQLNGGLKNV